MSTTIVPTCRAPCARKSFLQVNRGQSDVPLANHGAERTIDSLVFNNRDTGIFLSHVMLAVGARTDKLGPTQGWMLKLALQARMSTRCAVIWYQVNGVE